MKEKGKDIEKLYKDTKRHLTWGLLGHLFYWIPERYRPYVMAFGIILLAISGIPLKPIVSDLVKQRVLGTMNYGDTIIPPSGNVNDKIGDSLERDRISSKCQGAQFDINSEYFEVVGGERFFKEEGGVSAKDTKYYQSSVKSKWACGMPFIAKVVATPISGKSLGMFFEQENVFRVLVGDGDRVTIKVEENKWGPRGSWRAVKDENGNERQKLGNPIENGEEVILTVKAKEENRQVHLRVEVYHSKFQSEEVFNYFFVPNAVNFQVPQERKFRVGINDSRYKGEGSTIDFKTLSVEEGNW